MGHSKVCEEQPGAEDQAEHCGCSCMSQGKVGGGAWDWMAQWQGEVSGPAPPGVSYRGARRQSLLGSWQTGWEPGNRQYADMQTRRHQWQKTWTQLGIWNLRQAQFFRGTG